ncbi:MAG: von Willebrand factor type A domain-containing protein [Clostridia bacterium]|nr:von Willebrand factor type A domain-containing protein [Clostridia bacterium]
MKDNKYTRFAQKIEPSEEFAEQTMEKLRGKGSKHYKWLPALTSLTAVAAFLLVLALALPQIYSPLKGNTDALKPDMTTAADTVKQDNATVSTEPEEPADGGDVYEYEALYEDSAYEIYDSMPFMSSAMYATPMPMQKNAYMPEDFNTEEYAHISESVFKNVSTSPLSTFAIDVDTAGYSTLRRKLLNNESLPESSIRIEEMLNYFSYSGLNPDDGSDIKLSAATAPCPWNEDAALMFVAAGAKKIQTEDLPASNLVLLIDVSGSMDSPDKLDLAKRALSLMVKNLRACDRVSVVTYSGKERVVLEGASGDEYTKIMDAVNALEAYGFTNGEKGINMAYDLAEKYFAKGGNNRVIIMTDGDYNVGMTSEAELVELIEQKKQTGVFLSVLGFGMGNYKDSKLEMLADKGNGTYAYIDSINEARKVMVEEMGASFFTVAKDVKIQVEFNPDYVASYRLIGYENRALNDEDFADDTKDGGEMGSGHTVVALYELIPAQGAEIAGVKGTKSAQSDLKYQTRTASGIEEVATVSLRYKQPEKDESELMSIAVTPEMSAEGESLRNLQLAEAIAEFGMTLRNSDNRGTADFDMAFKTIQSLDSLTNEETELLYLISKARSLDKTDH